jgi:hypothetical protein
VNRYPAVVVIAVATLSASACSAKTPASSTPPTPAIVTVTAPAAAQLPAATSVAQPAAPTIASPTTVAVAAASVMPNVVHFYLDSAHKLLSAAGVADANIGDSTLGGESSGDS